MEELHACLKKHSCEYKKMLFVIDRYSRVSLTYKITYIRVTGL